MTDHLDVLSAYLSELGPAAVAVSGGVDSMTLAVVAHRVNNEVEMYHAISPAVPRQATERVKCYAEREGWRLRIINAGETEDPEYLANPANRCYFCKANLYDTIVANTTGKVMSGTNLDDLTDYRPGLEAAKEHQVVHPYVDCGISKQNLRQIAKSLDLHDLCDLPAAPCLSSRVETGIIISPDVLPVINEVELGIRSLYPTLENVRCRIRHNGIVLELDKADQLSNEQQTELRQMATEEFSSSTFSSLSSKISIETYSKGSAFLRANIAIDVTP